MSLGILVNYAAGVAGGRMQQEKKLGLKLSSVLTQFASVAVKNELATGRKDRVGPDAYSVGPVGDPYPPGCMCLSLS